MTPRERGWRIPSPWEAPGRFWLAWPSRQALAEEADAREDCLGLAALLAAEAPVSMLANPEDVVEASLRSAPDFTVLAAAHDESPLRRTAPLLYVDEQGRPAGGIGGAEPTARALLDALGLPHLEAPPLLEPALLAWDGAGTVLAAEALPERVGMGRAEAEALLGEWLGAEKVMWLKCALSPPSLPASFLARGVVAVAVERDPGRPGYAELQWNRAALAAARDPRGRTFTLVDLPSSRKRAGGCYADCLVAGRLVVVPEFEDARRDQEAFDRVVAALPEHKVVAYPASYLLEGFPGGLGSLVVVEPAGR